MSVSESRHLKELARQLWKSIENLCKDAAVFVDDSSAELLHWAGGVELLSGCVGVFDLFTDLTPVARDFIASVSSSQPALMIDNLNFFNIPL